ncbi:hypothetical protein NUW58_g687 [Xylaria curta]|uniref:Uncharacterized protein n=1 Tax=Xylaria curta TaxID=42375 RepID=A0ACC1PN92_9PEZI|nr:hypothetical protein NUW58_g687 [Xylaria curta]
MQDRAVTLPDASHLLIAGRASEADRMTAARVRPSRYRRQSYQSSYSQRSQWSQGDASNRNIVNPHDYDSVHEYNPRDYGRILSERAYEPPHRSVGFWHPQMKKVPLSPPAQANNDSNIGEHQVLILMAFVFAALSMYWGVFHNVQNNLSALEVHVVDFDSQVPPYNKVAPIVGPAMQELMRQIHTSSLSSGCWVQAVDAQPVDQKPLAASPRSVPPELLLRHQVPAQ